MQRTPTVSVKISTVLVVEDDPHSGELMRLLLTAEGLRVLSAVDGEAGLALAQAEIPDLITVDVRMPKLNGFEVCKRLKADPRTADIPVLMVTASAQQDHLQKGLDAGVDDFISKPIRKLEYLARVRSLLKVRHLKSDLDRTLAYLQELERL